MQSYKNSIKSDSDLLMEHRDYITEFIIEPLVKKGAINILGAERGTGKTRLCVLFAYSVAYGLDRILSYPIKNHGDVLFINLELTEQDFKTYLEPIKNYIEGQGYKQKFKVDTISFKNDSKLIFDDIIKVAVTKKYQLIIIDGLKMVIDYYLDKIKVKELTNSNVRKLYDEFGLIIKESGSILITAHTNKGTSGMKTNSDMLFGPGAVFDYASMISILRKTKEPNTRLIVPDKQRFIAEGEYGANLVSIQSDEEENKLWFELIEEDVEEVEHLFGSKKRHSEELKKEAVQWYYQVKSLSETAKKFLGDEKLKGTISKWIKKYKDRGKGFHIDGNGNP